MKNFIKETLRENLFNLSEEEKEGGNEGGGKKQKSGKKDYADLQNYFDRDLSFSQVDVMKKALGWPDDETGTNRSLFGKMLHQEKNEEGGLYQFNDEQIDKIRAAIKIK